MNARFSLLSAVCIGVVAGGGLIGSAGRWVLTERVARDVVASGAVILDTAPKQVRSTAGGTIAEMRVRDGDPVTAGEVMMRLDDPMTRGSLDTLGRALDELTAQQARLRAELDDAAVVKFPERLSARVGEPDIARLLAGEINLFRMRSLSRTAEKEQLRQRVSQLEREIGGYSVLMTAKDHELALIGQQLKGARDLRAKNLMPIATLTSLERDAVRLEGERSGQLVATVAQAEGRIAEMRLLIMQFDRDRLSELNRELRDTEARIADALERKLIAEDRVRRLEIRAPQDGIVRVPMLRMVGEDVAAGEEVMHISPRADGLIVEATIASRDIARLRLGQNAVLQFATAEPNGTARITGTLSRLAPDTADGRAAGFYRARIAVAAPECARLGAMRPGTQAEVLLETGAPNKLSGLLQPLGDGIARAWRAI
jgi:HlyD family secretion protein